MSFGLCVAPHINDLVSSLSGERQENIYLLGLVHDTIEAIFVFLTQCFDVIGI